MMTSIRTFIILFSLLGGVAANLASAADNVSFKRDIAPILLRSCQACHGPDKAKSKYRVDSYQALVKAGASDEPAIVKAKPDESALYRLLVTKEEDERMPQKADALPAEQVALIRHWIEQGATFDGQDPSTPLVELLPTVKHPAAPKKYPAALPITALAISKDGKQIAASGYHEITLWNVDDGKLQRRIGNIDQRTYALSISPDGQTLAAASGTPGERGEVRLFNFNDGKLRDVLCTTRDVMLDVQFSHDGKLIAAGGADSAIRLWEASTGALRRTQKNHADWVTAIAFDKDGKRFASASRDKTAKVFETKAGKQLASYSGHGQGVYGIAFHPDGQRLLSSGEDNRIHLWTIKDRKREESMSFGGDVFKLIRHGEHLFGSSADKTARLFSTSNRKELKKFAGHSDWVQAIAFHAQSNRLVTGSLDGEVRIWNAKDGKLIRRLIASPGFAVPSKP